MNKKVDLLARGLRFWFKILAKQVKIKGVNYPELDQFIVASWHANQCVFFNIKEPSKVNILVSRSNDGHIISTAVEGIGFKTIRGSQGRKGTEATLKMIEKLEQGEKIAITVDGPKGPAQVVKKGIINIAKISQVPIVPVTWFSKSLPFIQFNQTWDKFRFPVSWIKSVALYGEPIYVPQDCDDEGIELYRKKLEDELLRLDVELEENYDDYLKS